MWQRRIKLRRDYDVRPTAIKETNRQALGSCIFSSPRRYDTTSLCILRIPQVRQDCVVEGEIDSDPLS
ncbi:hypothetical protein CEP51_012407 [Fusarium floridanum]|uniref:Uncharacterized protein n=1 Tax=Fusarium floridanum TaxID=1325733 RepID=A0A428QUR0_9HYPO|nr:hypothetical protein CEP51_012407 [Fusarium floridanum]